MLAFTLTDFLIVAGVCIVLFFMIVVAFAYRIEAKSRMRRFFAGRDALTDRDFCRLVGSERLDEETCSALRSALGSQLGQEVEALLRPDDSARTLAGLAFDGIDSVRLFMDIEDRLRTHISDKDAEELWGSSGPSENLTLGEFAARLADHLKAGPQQRAADEDARVQRPFPGFLWVSVAGSLELAALALAVLVYHLLAGGLMMLGMEGGMAFALFFLVAFVVFLILAIGVRRGSRLAFVATIVALGGLMTRALAFPMEDLSVVGAILLCLTVQIIVPMLMRARFFFKKN